uniref:Uncharacterized protein n=1 Tax=Lepeophtheirus salmonis TaxID=72036 RepID=A0A0K2V961_LEPSM
MSFLDTRWILSKNLYSIQSW